MRTIAKTTVFIVTVLLLAAFVVSLSFFFGLGFWAALAIAVCAYLVVQRLFRRTAASATPAAPIFDAEVIQRIPGSLPPMRPPVVPKHLPGDDSLDKIRVCP